MRRIPSTRQGQRLRKISLTDLPPALAADPRLPAARPRTFTPLPPPVCIWRLPEPELVPGVTLSRWIAPRPGLAWRLTRGVLLFICAFGVTCLAMLALNWFDHPAQTTAAATAPAAPTTLRPLSR